MNSCDKCSPCSVVITAHVVSHCVLKDFQKEHLRHYPHGTGIRRLAKSGSVADSDGCICDSDRCEDVCIGVLRKSGLFRTTQYPCGFQASTRAVVS
jgi:hypothetical protein